MALPARGESCSFSGGYANDSYQLLLRTHIEECFGSSMGFPYLEEDVTAGVDGRRHATFFVLYVLRFRMQKLLDAWVKGDKY